jgi:dsRNA-specific ribonuclease
MERSTSTRTIADLVDNAAARSQIKSLLSGPIISSVSVLQEISDKFRIHEPIYECVEINGPRHMPIFKIKAEYGIYSVTTAGRSKRDAKRNAARQLVQKIKDLIFIIELH